MSIIYVDLEHGRVLDDPIEGPSHRARRDAALARLADVSKQPCQLLRFEDVSVVRIRTMSPHAVVISGNTADWSEYDFTELGGLIDTIRSAPAPILGICGGHQLIGHAMGATWGPLGHIRPGGFDPDPRFAPGLYKERGYCEIEVDGASPLFHRLGKLPVVFQSHYWQLTSVPEGFLNCASSIDSPIQAIARLDYQVFGVQFHPERYDDDHRDGEIILKNFVAAARPDPLSTIAAAVPQS